MQIEHEVHGMLPGQALHIHHRDDGTWLIIRYEFFGFLTLPKKFEREGATLDEALASTERRTE